MWTSEVEVAVVELVVTVEAVCGGYGLTCDVSLSSD